MTINSKRVTTLAVPLHSARAAAAACSPLLPSWSRADDKLFERALASCGADARGGRWEKVAALLPGRHPSEIESRFENLAEDVRAIEEGEVVFSDYCGVSLPKAVQGRVIEAPGVCSGSALPKEHSMVLEQVPSIPDMVKNAGAGNGVVSRAMKAEQERRKGVPWSEEEHKLFLLGLEKFGKGDWRSISRHFVRTRTATQVASHAQKYYNRQMHANKVKKRTSIHDLKLSATNNS